MLGLVLPPPQPLQELRVNPAEAAVAEHTHDIAALHLCRQMSDNGIRVRQIFDVFAFFDHADIYGKGRSEEVFAASVARLGLPRDSMLLQRGTLD